MKSVIIGTRMEKRDEDHDSEVMNMILMMLLMMMVVLMMMMMRRRRRSMRIGAADHRDKGKEEEEEGKNTQAAGKLQLEHPSSGDIPRSTDT